MPRPKGNTACVRAGFLTSGMVAKIIGCSPASVARMMEAGLLPGFQLPASQDRRVAVADLVRLLIARKIPVPVWVTEGARSVAFGLPDSELPPAEKFFLAPSAVDLGVWAADAFPIRLLVVGDDAGHDLALSACDAVRRKHPAARIVLCVSPDRPLSARGAADFVFHRPVNWAVEFGRVAFGDSLGKAV